MTDRLVIEELARVRKHRAPKGALRHSKVRVLRAVNVCHVRKHRAPKGALRQAGSAPLHDCVPPVRKHRAPKGALRPARFVSFMSSHSFLRQKAPSAKRCIKTEGGRVARVREDRVRKHRAPKGALRLTKHETVHNNLLVRKHRAPKGALRLSLRVSLCSSSGSKSESTERQKVH